jgi:acyl-CoA thioesterase YciA
MSHCLFAPHKVRNMPENSKTHSSTNQAQDHSVQLPTDRELVMRVMPMPADTNGNGAVFGGWIMAQMDLAGSVLPAKLSKGRVTTVAVNEFVFKQPVSVGDLLSFYAKVVRVGNTSMTVQIDVYAERNPADLHVVKVTEAVFTYVAIDGSGHPRVVPKA